MRIFLFSMVMVFSGCRTAQNEGANLEAALAGKPLILSANVENAFDGIDQGTEYAEFATSTSNWGPDLAQQKAKRVADVFAAANCPFIVTAAEVENQNAADMIAKAGNCNYKAYSANDDQSMAVGVAIFTNRPVTNVTKIETGYRPHLRVDFADGLTVIGVHFKSMRDGGDDLRTKAATAIRDEMAKIPAKNRVIVAGDFNTPDDILQSVPQLKNCTLTAPPTHFFHGQAQRLDKIYSTSCAETGRLAPSFLMRGGQPYRAEERRQGNRTIHEDLGYSDHFALYMMR